MKALSEQLAELSVRAKSVEDGFTAAEKEAREKVTTRKTEAIATAKTAVERVNQQIQSVGEATAKDWNALQKKIVSDMNAVMTFAANAKHDLEAQRAENRAELMECDAGFAIDYAIAAVEQARLAVLDAIDARLTAENERQAS